MYSFDIFDTLITRKTATCTGIFAIMQERIKDEGCFTNNLKNNFYDFRVQAEQLARSIYCHGEIEDITLRQIYEIMAFTGVIAAEYIDYFTKLEVEVELQNVIGIRENIDFVKKLLKEGQRVVAISDMYLDKNTIRRMLEIVDNDLSSIPIYVSSETKKTKHSGNMFRYVQREEKVDYLKWHHKGDNGHSDVSMPKRFGIDAEQYDYVKLNQIEKNLLDEKDFRSQLFIGSCKNANLFNRLSHKESMGCCIGGLILYPYVEWIVHSCIKKGIERLYFIARDGFILKKIADIIIKEGKYSITTKYIYGSRNAWRIPVIDRENFDETLKFSNMSHIHNIKDLGGILGLKDYEIHPFISKEFHNPDLILTMGLLNRIINILKEKDDFWIYLNRKNKEKRELAIAYLKQEVNTEDGKFAFVELHGSGYTQICLSKLLYDFYPEKINNFYYTMDTLPMASKCIFNVFIPGQLAEPLILETLCRANHGQTIEYHREIDKITPSLDESEFHYLEKYDYDEYVKGIILFTENICYKKLEDDIKVSLSCMRYIGEIPDKEVLDFIGDIPFELTGYKDTVQFAPILSKKQLFDIFVLQRPLESCYLGASFLYSEKRTVGYEEIDLYKKIGNSILGKWLRAPFAFRKHFFNFRENNVMMQFGMKKNSNVIIYGAGNLGNHLYKYFTANKIFHVVLWVDKWFTECEKRGLPVKNPETIPQMEFDYVVIAVVDYKNMLDIREKLILLEVNPDKINWINTFAVD